MPLGWLGKKWNIMPHAIDVLESDHHDIQVMLDMIAQTPAQDLDARQELLAKISRALRTHAQIEEEILYPALEKSAKSQSRQFFAPEGWKEFWQVEKLLLPDLEETALGSNEFTEWIRVLKELVARHVDEERSLFTAARELLSHEELDAMGQTMAMRKHELLHST